MPSTMAALKAAAILAFPVAHARNVFASYEGYSEKCTSCYSNKLSGAFSPAYTAGDNPLVAVCAAGNNAIFSPCDSECVDEYSLTFRQEKCMGSVKRDTSCETCWKSASQENGCLTPFVIAGNEYYLAECLCQPDHINSFLQCDSQCIIGGMSPSSACNMVALSKRGETTLSTSTSTTTVTVSPKTTPCANSTTTAVVPLTTAVSTSTAVIAANSTVPLASGTGSLGTSTIITNGTAPTESAPISNGAPALGTFGLASFAVVAALLFAFA